MKWPFFIFLLPLFFVFHGFVENFRAIDILDCLPLIAIYLGITLIFFLFYLLFLKNTRKAALMTLFIMSFYFFFGALHDFLRQNNIFLHKYSVILPVFLIASILLFVYLRKKEQQFARVCYFLNCLLMIYIFVDGITLAVKYHARDNIAKTYTSPTGLTYSKCEDCPRPDIYFLLFDEYANSRTLKNAYGYDNSALDSFLSKEGFHLQVNSRSNYTYTVLSMASLFNMSYLRLRHPGKVRGDDCTDALDIHRKEEAIQYLSSLGYTVVNHSPFDLPGYPSSISQPFILVKTKLITNRTLIDYIVRDIGLSLQGHFKQRETILSDWVKDVYNINQAMFSRTLEVSGHTSTRPRFVYMHLFMPHLPHVYDSLQRIRKFSEVDKGGTEEEKLREYLNYLPYTNARVKEVVSTIKKNTHGKAVIIFMSDHGLRSSLPGGESPFCNQNAIYLPDGNYRLFYDSLSAVNEFRVVFNTLFRQKIPFLKDSTIFLQDEQ